MFRYRRLLCVVPVLLFALGILAVPASAYEDTPPVGAPFTGCLYITGSTRELGSITVYLPVSYQSGYLGLDSSGNLFNVSNTSISGVFYRGSSEYTFRLSAWSTPQYRPVTGSSYNYSDLTFTSISASNVQIADAFPSLVPVSEFLSYVPILLLGVIVLCLFMKRF